ncbi:hypothetical protein AB0N17_43935 [Streptomyces sp. NPDC051133]|uniref:hypothetical protein n=1 Tax=Streptomyces sp. NPDC051133 TaxID=3155521 RepID=UPI00342E6D0C
MRARTHASSRARRGRFVVAGATAAAVVASALLVSSANGQTVNDKAKGKSAKEKEKAYENLILWMPGRVMGVKGTPPLVRNSAANQYCKTYGVGDGYGQCKITGFSETSRKSTLNYKERVSDYVFNCTPSTTTKTLEWSKTRIIQNSLGTDISLSKKFGISYDILDLIKVGAEVSASIGITYDYTWGEAESEGGAETLRVRPGYVGWIEYGSFHGTAHGIADVLITRPVLGSGMLPGSYRVVTDIAGDLPKPLDPNALKDQQVTGAIPRSVPMDKNELKQCRTNPTVRSVKTSTAR